MSDEPAHVLVRLSGWFKAGLWRHLTPTERDVLVTYCVYANRKGTAWPAVETIRTLTGHARTRIFEALRVLRRLKILEQVGRTARKGMEELGAKGPMIYSVAEPPPSLQEGFALSVLTARTQGPLTVHNVRTHSAGRFSPASTSREPLRPRGGKSASSQREFDRPHGEDRKGSEGEKPQGEKEQGEGEEGTGEGREPRTGGSAPPGPPGVSSHPPGGEPEEEARKEEKVEKLMAFFRDLGKRPEVCHVDHLLRNGYDGELISAALARVNSGG